MDQFGAVDGVFAVVAGVMMAAGNIDRAPVDEGVQLAGLAREHWRNLGRVVSAGDASRSRQSSPM